MKRSTCSLSGHRLEVTCAVVRRRHLAAAALFAATLVFAPAAGWAGNAATDKGIRAYKAGQAEAAVSALSGALSGGGLAGEDLARSYLYRGLAYQKLGKPAQAIADLTSALWLPGLDDEEKITAYRTRASAYQATGLGDRAAADLAKAGDTPRAPAAPAAAQTAAASAPATAASTPVAGEVRTAAAAPAAGAQPVATAQPATGSSGGGWLSSLFGDGSSSAASGTSPTPAPVTSGRQSFPMTRDDRTVAALRRPARQVEAVAPSAAGPTVSVPASPAAATVSAPAIALPTAKASVPATSQTVAQAPANWGATVTETAAPAAKQPAAERPATSNPGLFSSGGLLGSLFSGGSSKPASEVTTRPTQTASVARPAAGGRTAAVPSRDGWPSFEASSMPKTAAPAAPALSSSPVTRAEVAAAAPVAAVAPVGVPAQNVGFNAAPASGNATAGTSSITGWQTDIAGSQPAAQPAPSQASGGGFGSFLSNLFSSGSSTSSAQQPAAPSATAAAPSAAPAAGDAPATVQTASAATAVAPALAAPTGKYRLQVAALRTEAEAQAIAKKLSTEQAALIGVRAPAVEQAVLGNMGLFYRVQLGPFADQKEPSLLCNKLKRAGYDCFLMQ